MSQVLPLLAARLRRVTRPIADRSERFDAASFLVVFAFLLLCVPSRLVVSPIGAAGTPASLWGIAGLVWWACARLGGQVRPTNAPVRWALAGLVLTVLASYAAAMAQGWYAPPDVHQTTDAVYELVAPGVDEIRQKMMSAADRGLLAVGGWAGIVLVATDGLRTREQIERLVRWLVWFATAVAAVGVLQFYSGFDIGSIYTVPGLTANDSFGTVDARSVLRRVMSTAIHPIEFGVVMAALFPFTLHRALYVRRAASSWVPVAVVGVAILMSVSRSAVLVALTVSISLFLAWPPAWRHRALLIVPVAAVLLRIAIPGLLGTVRSLFTNLFNDPSTTGRLDDYDVVLRLWSGRPWFGRGLFTFIPEYYRTLDNQILVSFLELGAVGLLVVMLALCVGWATARGARRRSTDLTHRHLSAVVAAAIAGLTLSLFTFDAFTFPMAAGTLFLLLGLSGAAWNIAVSAGPRTAEDDEGVDSQIRELARGTS